MNESEISPSTKSSFLLVPFLKRFLMLTVGAKIRKSCSGSQTKEGPGS